jgi:hypothetical protein
MNSFGCRFGDRLGCLHINQMNSRSKASSNRDCIRDSLLGAGTQVDGHHNLFDGKPVNLLTLGFQTRYSCFPFALRLTNRRPVTHRGLVGLSLCLSSAMAPCVAASSAQSSVGVRFINRQAAAFLSPVVPLRKESPVSFFPSADLRPHSLAQPLRE